MGTFEELWKAVRVVGGESLKTSKPGDLDAFEATTGYKLPASYREFASAYGTGTLGDSEWAIAVPGYPGSGQYDLSGLNEWFRKSSELDTRSDADLAEQYDDPARVRRLVLFCVNIRPDYYGWDPQEITDPDAHEYAIYVLRHSRKGIEKVADTFESFLKDVAAGDDFKAWQAAETSKPLAVSGDDDDDDDDVDDEYEDMRIPFTPGNVK